LGVGCAAGRNRSSFFASNLRIGLCSPLGVALAVLIAWRLVEILATRSRIILYDRASPNWRHGTYTRSFLMLVLNVAELILLFGAYYLMSAIELCGSNPGVGRAVVYSWGRFFLQIVPYPAFCATAEITFSKFALTQATCQLVLIVFALSSLINMLSKGKEAPRNAD